MIADLKTFIERERPHWQELELPAHEKMTVLEALFDVLQEHDPTLGFRCACRVGMCGTCTVVVNGTERLACRTLISEVAMRMVTVRSWPGRNRR